MSTLLWWFAGCTLHLGTVPSAGFSVAEVAAPVAEPGVGDAVRAAVGQALAERRATGAEPLTLTVERADWRPGRRSGAVVIYAATLTVRFAAAGRERRVTASTEVPDPGTAAAAVGVRAAAFAELARRAADEGVTWLTLGGAPAAGDGS